MSTQIETCDELLFDIAMWTELAKRSADRLERMRQLNAPSVILSAEVRLLYRRCRIVDKLKLRHVARCN